MCRAVLHFRQGRYESSVACFERALQSRPWLAQAHLGLAGALGRLGRQRQAVQVSGRRLLAGWVGSGRRYRSVAGVLGKLGRQRQAVQVSGRRLRQAAAGGAGQWRLECEHFFNECVSDQST